MQLNSVAPAGATLSISRNHGLAPVATFSRPFRTDKTDQGSFNFVGDGVCVQNCGVGTCDAVTDISAMGEQESSE